MGARVAGRALALATSGESAPTAFHRRLAAAELVARRTGPARVAPTLAHARVDLNPHQIEAAGFALDALPRGGCVLADEVGLGKTIEAGLVIAQLAAEARRRALVLVPASLRVQWRDELWDKFGLAARIVDGDGPDLPDDACAILSIPYAARRAGDLSRVRWDVVVIDEAHRLRNAWNPTHRTGAALRSALAGRPKLLVTATPLQNSLLDLYGLTSFLDELPLGPEDAFRARFGAGTDLPDGAARELKTRLGGVVFRTLRRQVKEYVRFTARRSLVEDFAPSTEETELYDRVSRYLRRPDAAAIDPCRRHLMTLVFRKLLASSSFAIAPTLDRLADGLEATLRSGEPLALPIPDADAFLEEAEALDPASPPGSPARGGGWSRAASARLASEIRELRACAALARSIRVNAKGEALLRALDRAFTVAAAHGWPRKALVFTESRRTQAYLAERLAANGHRGRVTLLSGDGRSPQERQKVIEEFRDRSEILLSTEAGGEGLNLQFCNLVVNYDLPWNPQRIEQRIGRCHRYGQKRDVLVINFLNRSNAADARLYELLADKLQLFDGVFGASDEVLGTLADGIDFERRVLQIYQSCRTEGEVAAAFDALRNDVESQMAGRMAKARELLFGRFDADVRARLRLTGEAVEAEVARHRRRARCLDADGTAERAVAAARRVLEQPPAAPEQVAFAALPGPLAALAGRDGYWFVHRLELGAAADRLLHVALVREPAGWRALADDEAALLPSVPVRAPRAAPEAAPPPLGDAHERAVGMAQARAEAEARAAIGRERDPARERAMRFAEDCLLAPRQAVATARGALEEARRDLASTADAEREARRAALDRALRDHRRKLALVRVEEDRRYAELDERLAAVDAAAHVEPRRTLVAVAYWRA